MIKNTTDLAVVKTELQYIKKIIEDGFVGVHKRQDTANGKLMKHEDKLTDLDIKMAEVSIELKDKISTKVYDAGIINNVKDSSGLKSKVIYGAIGGVWTLIVLAISIYLPKIIGG